FLLGEERKWGAYGQEHLAIAPSDGSAKPTLVKSAMDLDRGISSPNWSPDGKAIFAMVTDDMSVYGARFPIDGGHAEPLFAKPVVLGPRHNAAGCAVVITGGDTKHNEIYTAFGSGDNGLRQLTHAN